MMGNQLSSLQKVYAQNQIYLIVLFTFIITQVEACCFSFQVSTYLDARYCYCNSVRLSVCHTGI